MIVAARLIVLITARLIILITLIVVARLIALVVITATRLATLVVVVGLIVLATLSTGLIALIATARLIILIGLDQYIYMFALNLLYVCVNWLAIVRDKRNAFTSLEPAVMLALNVPTSFSGVSDAYALKTRSGCP